MQEGEDLSVRLCSLSCSSLSREIGQLAPLLVGRGNGGTPPPPPPRPGTGIVYLSHQMEPGSQSRGHWAKLDCNLQLQASNLRLWDLVVATHTLRLLPVCLGHMQVSERVASSVMKPSSLARCSFQLHPHPLPQPSLG